ncbi:MAG: PKD domain-containing protein, partial [Thermoplasmata archaeon]|nr:PKD domain-containing protein [Thermoplasmata archaeon]
MSGLPGTEKMNPMEHSFESKTGRWSGRRGVGTAIAAIVMVIVIALVGAGTYVGLNAQSHGPKHFQSCSPPSSPVCVASAYTHDLGLLVPFKAAQTGNTVPFTAILPAGETASSYSFNFGDGSPSVSNAQPIATHVYTTAGTYLVSTQAVIGGVTHDNYQKLATVGVAPAFTSA